MIRPWIAGGAIVIMILVACTTSDPVKVGTIPLAGSSLKPYPDLDRFLQCVPFARTVSGVALYGDAWTWWEQATGHYQRGNIPQEGAILVFRKSPRLKLGHVAVVVQVSGKREMFVTHANWGNDNTTHGTVHERQPTRDVSPYNDWTLVQLKNRRGQWGSSYATHGFIYQTHVATTTGTIAVS